ncbi:MAG: hypothetical protein HY727_02735 [Candidatus Rokubacteria bacterium]|nr:hypothetical protein [Candidatus Rokubacteria bacterium]
MKRLFFLIVLAAAASYYFLGDAGLVVLPWGGGGSYKFVPRGEGRALLVTKGDSKVDFTVGRDVDETFMLFGAQTDAGAEYLSAWFAGITMPTAIALYKRYPDFHMCKSAGAAEAQRSVQDLSVVSDQAAVRDELAAFVKDFHERIRSGGRRLCLRLVGHELELNSWEYGGAKMAFGSDLKKNNLFVDRVEAYDCQELLTGKKSL